MGTGGRVINSILPSSPKSTTHVDRLFTYLEVKVWSPTYLLTPCFVAIAWGVLLPRIVEFPMSYTYRIGTCDAHAH